MQRPKRTRCSGQRELACGERARRAGNVRGTREERAEKQTSEPWVVSGGGCISTAFKNTLELTNWAATWAFAGLWQAGWNPQCPAAALAVLPPGRGPGPHRGSGGATHAPRAPTVPWAPIPLSRKRIDRQDLHLNAN